MAKQPTIILDADSILFAVACKAQPTIAWDKETRTTHVTEPFEVSMKKVEQRFRELKETLKSTALIVCLSCSKDTGFRVKLAPSIYKSNRGAKPERYYELRRWVETWHNTKVKPELEADDIVGVLATHPKLVPGDKIIVSIDKDLLQIPGPHYNYQKPDMGIFNVTPEEGEYNFYFQTLVGDSCDHYPGCPGIGLKRANALLGGVTDYWKTVVSAFGKKGLTEKDALLQARLARICRHTDYDFVNQKVIPWTPSSP